MWLEKAYQSVSSIESESAKEKTSSKNQLVRNRESIEEAVALMKMKIREEKKMKRK
jgi:hypothetical protein